jgi:hypothetical protein
VFMRVCTLCISCIELPLLPKRARFLSEPPPNFGISVHFCDFQNSQHREFLAIQSSANPGKTISKTFAKSLSQKYPNSFSKNTKDHLHFPGSDCTKFSNSAATLIPVVCATEQRPLPCEGRV